MGGNVPLQAPLDFRKAGIRIRQNGVDDVPGLGRY